MDLFSGATERLKGSFAALRMTTNFNGVRCSMSNLTLLRAELTHQSLDGFIVPHADEYQNEYLPAGNERLAWLTGFTGSAGLAIVTRERAALFADGRYTLQAASQSPDFEQHHLVTEPPEKC